MKCQRTVVVFQTGYHVAIVQTHRLGHFWQEFVNVAVDGLTVGIQVVVQLV
jgi:hypothetical protein